ncbi:MAG: glycogen synthase GlgA [Desulfobacterales bacterium]|nr:glycogen synthase GlgA [Desulfobacterales bacterium]
MSESLRVWFLASEVAPFAKTGGLADVAGALPSALKKLGVDVRVGLPFYRMVRDGGFATRMIRERLKVPLGEKTLVGDVLETATEGGVPVYLFDLEDIFDQPELYGTPEGDYADNLERFAYFCRAALLFAKEAGLHFDVVHCHDWQTGLIPAYLKTLYREDPALSHVASVFTVHNVGYQGLFPADKLAACGLPATEFGPEGIEYWGKISLLKAGIVYADAITTVSPMYSREIQTPEFGLGMDGTLKRRSADLYGILNGADYSIWNPATDRHIRANYSLGDMKGKAECKSDLIHEVGLDQRLAGRPVLGIISRLAAQKGHDLLARIAEHVVRLDAGLVILGAGEEKYQTLLSELGQKYPENMAVMIRFDEPLAHRIMAGADMLLVPSRYEPCGLTQIYALRYGTVPIVRATGGLDDTIEQFDPKSGEGTGFKFADHEAGAFLEEIKEAVKVYDDKTSWKKLVKNGMRADFSWEESAGKYVLLYEKVAKRALPIC